jgi:two-component system sporulation sensor kinase A
MPGDQPVSGLWIADEKGAILWVNPAFSRLTGIPKEDILGQIPHTRITYQWDSHFFRQVWERNRSERAWTGEAIYRRPDETLTLEVTVSPLPDVPDGSKKSIVVMKDITRQNAASAVLQESETRFRQAVEQSPLLIATLQGEHFTFINRIGAQILGYNTPQEVIGRPWTEFVEPQTISELQKMGVSFLNQPQTRPSPWDIPVHRPDGTSFILETSFTVSSAEGQPLIQVIGQDITERKRVQEALRRQACLAEVDVTISEPGEPSKVLDKVVEVAKQVLQVGIRDPA